MIREIAVYMVAIMAVMVFYATVARPAIDQLLVAVP